MSLPPSLRPPSLGSRLVLLFLPWLLFLALVLTAARGQWQAEETLLLIQLHQLSTPFVDALFTSVSFLASGWVVVPLSLLMAVVFWGRGHRREALSLIVVLTLAGLGNLFLKELIARPRPDLWSSAELTDFAFPSGHAMVGLAVYGWLALMVSRHLPRLRWLLIGGIVILMLLVGLSRLYLGVHWPTDIIGGWLAGVGVIVGVGGWEGQSRINSLGQPPKTSS